MIPISGSFSMFDVRTELGQSGIITISGALADMGDVGDPDEMFEMRGYDNDWKGWMQVSFAEYTYESGNLAMTVQNKSTEKSKSGILYWELYESATKVSSGNIATGTISASSNSVVNDTAAPHKSPTHIKVRFSGSASWQTVNL